MCAARWYNKRTNINSTNNNNGRQKRGNAIIAEHGKPELIVLLSNPNDIADKKIRLSTSDKAKSDFMNGANGRMGGRGRNANGLHAHLYVRLWVKSFS
jgi:hypothetical protein